MRPDTTECNLFDDGRSRRHDVPRHSAASWEPAPRRPDPVEVLAAQDAGRVPALVPLRHARMGVSPFTFYRGAAALMAADLASFPVTGLDVQLAGDAHLSNLGAFASPARRLLFDLNDFDETLRGPWEWDVHRLATSFTIAGRARGFAVAATAEITASAVRAYREAMASFARTGPLDVWYSRLDTDELRASLATRSKRARREFDVGVASARRRTSLQATRKLTHEVDGKLRFVSDPPVLVPLSDVIVDVPAEQIGDDHPRHLP